MGDVIYNITFFVLEFLKMSIICLFILNFKCKNVKTAIITIVSTIALIGIISVFFNISEYNIIFGCISILLICIHTIHKNKVGLSIATYVLICIIDMFLATVIMSFSNISVTTIDNNIFVDFSMNSISLLLIVMISILKQKFFRNQSAVSIKKGDIATFLIGGISLGVYITSIILFAFQDSYKSYLDMVALAVSVSSVIFIIIFILLIINRNRNERLKIESEINAKLLSVQENYYLSLLRKDEETKKFRHDISNHLYCMQTLLENNEYEKLKGYFQDVNGDLKEMKKAVATGNSLVDAIVNDLADKHNYVTITWRGKIYEELKISSMDLCTVFSNLLSNAFESAEKSDCKEVDVSVKILETNLFITIMNHYNLEPTINNGQIISTKPDGNHGYGIKNVKSCLEKNNGSFDISLDGGCFTANVVFCNAI